MSLYQTDSSALGARRDTSMPSPAKVWILLWARCTKALTLNTVCLCVGRTIWWIPVFAEKNALLSGLYDCFTPQYWVSSRSPLGVLNFLLLSTGGGGELGHHRHVWQNQKCLPKIQRQPPSSWCSRLLHRPIQDTAMAEKTPGGGDQVPPWDQMSRTWISPS